MPRIGIVAGEASGDLLGSDLISALKAENAEIKFIGIGGESMKKAGCECIYPVDKLAVMGISEVFSNFIEILKIRHHLERIFLADPPDLFIGIDAPDFNFPLEKKLRQSGIKTVHYVSPSIWAWREYRLKSIAKSVDMMLTLFPFEPAYYQKCGIPVTFTGHPLAKKISPVTDKKAARLSLGLPVEEKILAIMPGSRTSELKKLVKPFLQAAALCREQVPNLVIISNLVRKEDKEYVESQSRLISPELDIRFYSGQSLEVMAAADAVLLASGTAALEAMLLKRPMVVAYKVNWLTYQLAKRLIRLPYVSLPNVLAGRKIVPECLQKDCEPEILCNEIIKFFKNSNLVKELDIEFRKLHENIQPSSDNLIARVILGMIDGKN